MMGGLHFSGKAGMRVRALILSVAAALAWGLSGAVRSEQLPRTPADTLVVASDLIAIRNLSPGATYVRTALMQLNNVYERLLVVDPEAGGAVMGQVAKSYRISEDGLAFTFTIRDGLRFHSGNPVRAEDVVYSLMRVAKLERGMARFLNEIGITADNVDTRLTQSGPNEVTLRLAQKLAPSFVLNILASPVSFVVDRKLVMAHEENGDFGHSWLSRNSAGSGPYRVLEWEPKQWLILEAFDGHHGGTASIRRVVIRDIQEPTLRRLLIAKGDADIATDLGTEQLLALRETPGVSVQSRPAARVIYMVMNQANPLLQKPEVRQAINLLIDREVIAGTVLKDTFRAHQGFWPAGLWASLKEVVYRRDVALTRSLLADAGYPDGLELEMDSSTQAPYPEIAQSMQAMLAEGGISLLLTFGDDAQNLTKMMSRNFSGLITRSFNVVYADPNDGVGWMIMNEDNADSSVLQNAAWRARYINWDLNTAAKAALVENDTDRRRQMYIDMQRKLQQDGVVTILFQQIYSAAIRHNVSGFYQGPLFDQMRFKDVTKH